MTFAENKKLHGKGCQITRGAKRLEEIYSNLCICKLFIQAPNAYIADYNIIKNLRCDCVYIPICDGDKLSFLISKEEKLADQELGIEDNPCPDNWYSNKVTYNVKQGLT